MKYKRTITYQIILAFALFFCLSNLKAQETIGNAGGYPVLKNNSPKLKTTKGSLADTLELPFFDDFSNYVFYPDNDKWADNYAFINNTYPIEPPSIGVATLDAISNSGEFYEVASYGNYFSADSLSSLPINLDYPGDNSIYLSFYYQPQGLGDNPEPADTLLLEFYAPVDSVWEMIWFAEGTANTDFQHEIIQITDAKYLKKGFRFRFRNIASLSSDKDPSKVVNADHWHIDYVYLNSGRYAGDIYPPDIAFVYPMASHLKNYEAMPWKHFLVDTVPEIGTNVEVTLKNNDNISRLLDSLNYVFYDNSGNTPSDTLEGGSHDIHFNSDTTNNPPFTYPFLSNSTDSASFTIKAWFVTDGFDYKGNNEVSYIQRFYDYYAYDDGTAEASYGLTGEGTQNARLAYRFDCKKQDTLKAIQMCFSRSLNDASRKFFFLTVWDNVFNEETRKYEPGKVIYQKEAVRPEYEDKLNKFHAYFIDTTLVLEGVFYVGWIQTTSDMLNVGLDFNRVRNENIFYNIGGNWENSKFEAALMIRPFFGQKLTLSAQPIPPKINPEITVYPNPTEGFLNIDIGNMSDYEQVSVQVFSLSGSLVHQSTFQNNRPIDLLGLREGVYLLRLIDRKKRLNYTYKIIKTK